MEITYIAHSCFKIKGKDLTIVIDPYDPKKTFYKLPKLSADLVLSTHDHFDHNYVEGVSDYKMVIDRPGEYEIQEVYIEGFKVFHDEKNGEERGSNTMFQITMDDLNILHCGDLGHELQKQTLEKILDIDVLLIPVGGTYTIDPDVATKVISSIEPGIVVPMHYQTEKTELSKDLVPLQKFLDEMGDDNVQKLDILKLSGKSDIPEETQVIVINPTNQ